MKSATSTLAIALTLVPCSATLFSAVSGQEPRGDKQNGSRRHLRYIIDDVRDYTAYDAVDGGYPPSAAYDAVGGDGLYGGRGPPQQGRVQGVGVDNGPQGHGARSSNLQASGGHGPGFGRVDDKVDGGVYDDSSSASGGPSRQKIPVSYSQPNAKWNEGRFFDSHQQTTYRASQHPQNRDGYFFSRPQRSEEVEEYRHYGLRQGGGPNFGSRFSDDVGRGGTEWDGRSAANRFDNTRYFPHGVTPSSPSWSARGSWNERGQRDFTDESSNQPVDVSRGYTFPYSSGYTTYRPPPAESYHHEYEQEHVRVDKGYINNRPDNK